MSGRKGKKTSSGKRIKYEEKLVYDDSSSSSSSSSSSASSGGGGGYRKHGMGHSSMSSSSSSSDETSGSSSHGDCGRGTYGYGRQHYGSRNSRNGAKREPKSGKKRPNFVTKKSGDKKVVRPTVTSEENVKVVRAIDSSELEDMNWGKTVYTVRVEGSLNELLKRSGTDAEGNQKPLRIFLGEGMRVDRAPEEVHARIEANKRHPQATHEMMSSNPSVLANHSDIVRRVNVSGHNQFPGTVEVVLDNIQGSASNVQYAAAAAADGASGTQSLVIRAEAGEKLDKHQLLLNDLTEEDIRHLQYYSGATIENLDCGVERAPPRNGKNQVMVPYSDERPHIVIDKVLAEYKRDPNCCEEHRREIKKTGNLPAEVLYKSEDYPGYIIMAKDLFDDYKERCISSLKKTRPLSDLSHPHGTFTRVISQKHFASKKARVKSQSAMDEEAVRIWDHPEGTQVGLVSEQAKKHVFEKQHCAWFRVSVLHAPIDQIRNNDDDDGDDDGDGGGGDQNA